MEINKQQDTPLTLIFKYCGDNNYTDSTKTMAFLAEKAQFIEFAMITRGMSLEQMDEMFDTYYIQDGDGI